MPKVCKEPIAALPRAGPLREALRVKGQFWTPEWVADFMAAYVLQNRPDKLLDPAMGEGVFLRAAKRYARKHGIEISLHGRDLDPTILEKARISGLTEADLANVEIRDFVLDPRPDKYPAVIANPPYIRHHRLSVARKRALRQFAHRTTGLELDGRAGLHVYFLLRTLSALAPQGRLAYIVSADICEGVFADSLWRWICKHFRLDAGGHVYAAGGPFPQVDTNALVFFISNSPPQQHFDWVECSTPQAEDLIRWIEQGQLFSSAALNVSRRLLAEALSTGLSRPPATEGTNQYTLGDFASVMRGIVTGDNEFFFLTTGQANTLKIPPSLLVRALGRTRDVQGELFTKQDLERLDACGRPTWLLSLNGEPFSLLPPSVKKYLRTGEKQGLPDKTLIKTRKPWYRMETRRVPPILFAYLGRRNTRFIRNWAGVVPLTCLLCIYPKQTSSNFIERLWRVLAHPDTVNNLRKVGKSYGSGAIKVEPRALERLPLPDFLVKAENLDQFFARPQGLLDLFGEFTGLEPHQPVPANLTISVA